MGHMPAIWSYLRHEVWTLLNTKPIVKRRIKNISPAPPQSLWRRRGPTGGPFPARGHRSCPPMAADGRERPPGTMLALALPEHLRVSKEKNIAEKGTCAPAAAGAPDDLSVIEARREAVGLRWDDGPAPMAGRRLFGPGSRNKIGDGRQQ